MMDFKGKKIWSSYIEGETLMTGHDRRPTKQEVITLYAYGANTSILKEFIDEAVSHSITKDDGKIAIYE